MKKLKRYLKYSILLLSLGFIALGIEREEHLLVLQKAINICFECIGLG